MPQVEHRSLINMYLLDPAPAHRSVSGPIRINTHKNFHIYVLFTSILYVIESQSGRNDRA